MRRRKSSILWDLLSEVSRRVAISPVHPPALLLFSSSNTRTLLGLIAFASYNPIKNNVKRDVIILSIANIVTSLYTAFVIFCVLGFMGHNNYVKCIEKRVVSSATLCASALERTSFIFQEQRLDFRVLSD